MQSPTYDEAPRILVVDDERVIRDILSEFLTMEGFVVRSADNGQAALDELTQHAYDLVVSDLKMPVMGGLGLLEAINKQNIDVLSIIMTGFGTVETAIDAMKKGAYDYILKPFKVEEVVHVIRRGLDRQRLKAENMRLKEALGVYKISEAMAQSLSVDPILELITDAALEEVGAELVTIVLRAADQDGRYSERMRKTKMAGEDLSGELDLAALLPQFESNTPVLVHGQRVIDLFTRPPRSATPVSFCAVPLTIHGNVLGMINLYAFTRGKTFTEGQRKMLSILGSRAAVSIENARLYENLVQSNTDLELANLSLEENFRQTIVALAMALEENDPYTRGHSERVSEYARLIAQGLGMSPLEVTTVVQSALMHDIGKIGIRHEHLNKASKLTSAETAMFRNHPEKGKRILEPIPFLQKLIPGCYCHHEHWDGSGYPQGLKGEEIPMLGRIIAVADTYDAMTTNRAYRKALPHQTAVAELIRCSGSQFDPHIVEVFLVELERYREGSGDYPVADEQQDAPELVPELP